MNYAVGTRMTQKKKNMFWKNLAKLLYALSIPDHFSGVDYFREFRHVTKLAKRTYIRYETTNFQRDNFTDLCHGVLRELNRRMTEKINFHDLSRPFYS